MNLSMVLYQFVVEGVDNIMMLDVLTQENVPLGSVSKSSAGMNETLDFEADNLSGRRPNIKTKRTTKR